MSSSISSFDLETIEIILTKGNAKIINTYLYELIWLMEKDELNYLKSVVENFNNELDRKIAGD